MESDLELLYRAAASPIGIAIRVSDFTAIEMRLRYARKQSLDPDLMALKFRRTRHDPCEMWLVKSTAVPEREFAAQRETDIFIDELLSKAIP